MVPTKYQCKSGRYEGKWHVRVYRDKKYFHIGRFNQEAEANKAIHKTLQKMHQEMLQHGDISEKEYDYLNSLD